MRLPENGQSFIYPQLELGPYTTNAHLQENRKPLANYFDPKWVTYLNRNLNRTIFDNYRAYPIYIFDQVEWLKKTDFDLEKIGRSLAQSKNRAFVAAGQNQEDQNVRSNRPFSARFDIVTKQSGDVQVAHFGMNNLILNTSFLYKRFLVYNDSYYDGWQAFVNGKKTTLYRTNVAFKGLWVPEGKNVVEFRFGYGWQYVLNYGLLMLFYVMFIFLIYLWMNDAQAIQRVKRMMRKCLHIGV